MNRALKTVAYPFINRGWQCSRRPTTANESRPRRLRGQPTNLFCATLFFGVEHNLLAVIRNPFNPIADWLSTSQCAKADQLNRQNIILRRMQIRFNQETDLVKIA